MLGSEQPEAPRHGVSCLAGSRYGARRSGVAVAGYMVEWLRRVSGGAVRG